MATIGNVRVGDVGTHYKAKIQDAGAPFDPTLASTAMLIFSTPVGVLPRDATITHEGDDWFLNYTLTAEDDADFHARQGVYRWQGFVEFTDGTRYRTNIESFVVEANLS